MTEAGKKSTGPAPSRVIRSFAIVVVLAILMGVSAGIIMDSVNRKMGFDSDENVLPSDSFAMEEVPESITMPEFDPVQVIATGSSVWAPDWKTTPCSIFLTSESEAILDSLPESPGPASRNTELQLLMEIWADHSGFSDIELERVWVFASGDSVFVDLPRSGDWQGVVRTIEGRFISYTVLFPFVAGEILEGFEDGISVLGVPSSR